MTEKQIFYPPGILQEANQIVYDSVAERIKKELGAGLYNKARESHDWYTGSSALGEATTVVHNTIFSKFKKARTENNEAEMEILLKWYVGPHPTQKEGDDLKIMARDAFNSKTED